MTFSISGRHLSTLISLLAREIKTLRTELRDDLEPLEALSEEALEGRLENQETLEAYELMLDDLQEEYIKGLAAGENLPSFDSLVAHFLDD